MSIRYLARDDRDFYLTARKATGRVYESRAQWSDNLDDARVFQTKAAAVNAGRQAGGSGDTIECSIII